MTRKNPNKFYNCYQHKVDIIFFRNFVLFVHPVFRVLETVSTLSVLKTLSILSNRNFFFVWKTHR